VKRSSVTASPWRGRIRARGRTLLLAVGSSALGAVGLAGAAAADVVISPTEAVRGDAVRVTFHVHNHHPGVHTTVVRVDLPAATPVAEVYPLSVPDWTPTVAYRPAERPLPGIHGDGIDQAVSSAVSSVTWTRAQDAPPAPATDELELELGPLPQVATFAFTVTQKHSDGTAQRWSAPSAPSVGGSIRAGTSLTLRPATATGTSSQGGSTTTGSAHGHHDAALPAATVSHAATIDESHSPTVWWWVRRFAGVVTLLLALGLRLLRLRRAGSTPDLDGGKEPVTEVSAAGTDQTSADQPATGRRQHMRDVISPFPS